MTATNLAPHDHTKQWNVSGVALFPASKPDQKPRERVVRHELFIGGIWAASTAEAEQKFAEAFTFDVRVTKIEGHR
jgi:hypothetical protein